MTVLRDRGRSVLLLRHLHDELSAAPFDEVERAVVGDDRDPPGAGADHRLGNAPGRREDGFVMMGGHEVQGFAIRAEHQQQGLTVIVVSGADQPHHALVARNVHLHPATTGAVA